MGGDGGEASADGAPLVAISREMMLVNEAEHLRVSRSLRKFKWNTCLLVVLMVVWVFRSAEELSVEQRVAGAAGVVALLVVVNLLEHRSLRKSKSKTDAINEQISAVADDVKKIVQEREDLLKKLATQERQEQQQQRNELRPASFKSERSLPNSLATSSFSSTPGNSPRGVDGLRTESLRADGTKKKKGVLRRMLSRRSSKRSSKKGTGATFAAGPREDPILRTQSMQNPEHEQVKGIQHAKSMRCDGEEGSPGEGDGEVSVASSGESTQMAGAPGDDSFLEGLPFAVTQQVDIAVSDILQPEEPEGIAELRNRMADVVTPVFEARMGGPVRSYDKFLRARNFKVSAAEKMMRETVKFRATWGLDEPDGEHAKERERAFQTFRDFWMGKFIDFTSDDGSPMQYFAFKDVRPKQLLKAVSEKQFSEVYLAWMERTLDVQNRANSRQYQTALRARDGEPIDQGHDWKGFLEIYDLGGIGMQQLYLPGILMLTRILKLGQGHYPENLRACFIVNAPWFFSGTFNIISRILDQATRDKITVSSKIPRDRLAKYLSPEKIDRIFVRSE